MYLTADLWRLNRYSKLLAQFHFFPSFVRVIDYFGIVQPHISK